MAKKVIVVGAGYAGVETALRLNKKKKKTDDLEITIIDKNDYHSLLTELHEVAGNRVSEDAIRIPLHRIFRHTDVKVVTDEIADFDFDNKKLISDSNEYAYDYLVLAIGSTPNYYDIPGLKEHAFPLWSMEDAVNLREHIKRCFLKASNETNEEKRKALLTFTVAGAGFTGVEIIGELAHWVPCLCKERDIDPSEVRLIILDALHCVLNEMPQKISDKARRYLEQKLGVEVLLNTSCIEMTQDGFHADDLFIPTKTMIWAAGIRAVHDVDDMPIEKPTRSFRLAVDEYLKTEQPGVYAVGDVMHLKDDSGKEYPAMVETAIQTGKGAADNILRAARKQNPEKVSVKLHGSMVSVGNYYAVSYVGGKMYPFWMSILIKMFVSMHYLWEITGFYGVSRYLYHQFVDRRQRKHFLEKHWSRKMQVWWLMPLRMFLGLMWLIEGIGKVSDGWLSSPKLSSFLGFATDADAAATPAANVVRRYDDVFAINLRIVDFFIGKETMLVDGERIGSNLFAKIDFLTFGQFSLIPWILENIVLATRGTEMFFQGLVVILEIVVGLMFLGGFLTFFASLMSMGLLMMFVTTTGMYDHSWYMFFAAFAFMGGAGRAFGMDHYVVPYLANVWEYFWKNKKLKLWFKGILNKPL